MKSVHTMATKVFTKGTMEKISAEGAEKKTPQRLRDTEEKES